jgi:SNF2 family DNA or RNA helicase
VTNLVEWPASLREPWKHQHEGYDRLGRLWYADKPGVALFAGMGTGKSLVALALWKSFGFERVLIISPRSMVEEWPEVIGDETRESFRGIPLLGKTRDRYEELVAWRRRRYVVDGPVAYVVNHDVIWREGLKDELLRAPWDAVMIDESQSIKAPGSKTSLFAARLSKHVPYRLAMTGTPLHDKPLDAYGQYRFLDDTVFGTRYDVFKRRYSVEKQISEKVWIVAGYINQDEFTEKFHSIAFRVPDDVVDLPELVEHDRFVNLSKPTRKLYDTFEKDMIIEVDGSTLAAGNILSRRIRLQQITSGYAPLTDAKGIEHVEDLSQEKTDVLKELVDAADPNKPIVVFARFSEDLRRIRHVAALFGRAYFEQSGKANQWRDWRSSSEPAIIGVQIQSGGSGINLTRAPIAIFYSHGDSLGDYEQAVKRIHRPGQKDRTMIYHIIARGTVDVSIRQALRDKSDVNSAIVDRWRQGSRGAH